MKIMNLGDMQTAKGVAAVLQNDDDDAVDPHLARIRNEAGDDESDEEASSFIYFWILCCISCKLVATVSFNCRVHFM